MTPLQPATLRDITRIFDSLDYQTLGPVYCDEGGDAFWEERRGPGQEQGPKVGAPPADRLHSGPPGRPVGAAASRTPPRAGDKTPQPPPPAVCNPLTR